ncbi:MAG: SGNH/GDSL hydrolase family protein [Clostridia bacterium]
MQYQMMELHNVVGFEENDKGKLAMTRLPEKLRNEMVQKHIAFECAGVEIRFKMKDPEVTLVIHSLNEQSSVVRLMHGCYKASTALYVNPGRNEFVITKPNNMENLILMEEESDMPFDSNMVRVLLNGGHYGPPEIIGALEPMDGVKRPKLNYFAYGSSITAGGSALLPDMNYVAWTAQQLKAEHFNYGFSGSANLERAMADHIAAQKNIRFLSMELGVNMVWDMAKNDWASVDLFKERVEYFIPTIAEAHKDIPVVCIDIFLNGNDLKKDQEVFDFRDVVRNEAIKFERKNKNFKYVCGKDLLTSGKGLSIDLLHPSTTGMVEIGDRLAEVFRNICYQMPQD